MTFEDELNDLLETTIDGWIFNGTKDNPDTNATIFFAHTPSEDRPNRLPLPMTDLYKLDREYGVVSVSSVSNGRTGSRLTVSLEDV